MRAVLAITLSAALLGGCNDKIDAGGSGVDAGSDDDPLSVTFDPAPGSLDYIQKTIIFERCSGQPGLCHNGQFEPNLSTAASTYAYLVRRPGLEEEGRYRVDPGHPELSLLIDKLRNRDVSTQMPLGADPLSEDEIQMIEAWITDGALRRPGADPAPELNEPPLPPEIAVYDQSGTRLDSTGTLSLQVGQSVRLRHSVSDFETADPDIAFATFVLSAGDGWNVELVPGAASDPQNGITSYDAGGPMGTGDQLDYVFDWTVPATLTLIQDGTGATRDVPAGGQTLTPIALYIDDYPGGIIAFDFGAPLALVQP